MVLSCGYSDGGTSRKNSLDLVMKAIRSVITCPDFDINSERAQKAVMYATKLLHWAEKNEDRFNGFAVSLISHLESCFNSSSVKKQQKVRELMWESYFKLCSSDDFWNAWCTIISGTIGLQATPIFYQHVTSKIFEDLLKDHFSVPVTNDEASTSMTQMSLSYEECNALRYSIGYVVRSLIKKLNKSKHSQKEEMIQCLCELIVEKGK